MPKIPAASKKIRLPEKLFQNFIGKAGHSKRWFFLEGDLIVPYIVERLDALLNVRCTLAKFHLPIHFTTDFGWQSLLPPD